MKQRLRWLAGLAALAGAVVPCAAQTEAIPTSGTTTSPAYLFPHPFHHRLRPPSLEPPLVPADPSRPVVPAPTDPAAPRPSTDSLSDALSGAGQYKSSPGRLSPVLAGTGLGSAVSGDPISTNVFTPLVIPGLFNACSTQSALPMDRIHIDYGYFNRVLVAGVGSNAPTLVRTPVPPPPPTPPPPSILSTSALGASATDPFVSTVSQSGGAVPGFNLNTFNVGIEKTLFDGLASVYVTVPFLHANDNISGQQINGLGDVSAGFKVILYQNLDTRTTLTGGFTIAFPTAHPAISNSLVQSLDGRGDVLLPSSSASVNPTFLQPWLAGLLVLDRAWAHEYIGVVVPTDSRVATFLNSDFTVGYQAYRASGNLLSSVTPTLSAQVLVPLNHQGTPDGQLATTFVPSVGGVYPTPDAPSPFTFQCQVYAIGGIHVGISNRLLLTGAVIVPVAAPRSYSAGASFGLNYFY